MSDPAAASARAMPSPIPLVEPVTSDTLSARVPAALRFSGLTATFMARALRCSDVFAPICRTGATQRQCQLAKSLIEFRYGNASGQIFPGDGQRAQFHQGCGDVQRDAA